MKGKALGVFFLIFCMVFNVYGLSAMKKTVAVIDFSNDSGYNSLPNLGRDFSMQLSDALIQSGKFIVLSRKSLNTVMAEQDLANSNRFAKAHAARLGKIIPAQILIKGKITEFEENTSGGGQGLSIHGFSLSARKSSAHVAVIIQLVDSTTGEIIDSKRVEGNANASGFSLGYSGSFSLGTSNFKKTPLGKAVQMAIDRAVVYIADKMSHIPWKGRVVLVKNNQVYINAGRNTGVQSGNIFFVLREGEVLVDPDTGMELGRESKKIGEIQVTEVQDKFSKAKIISASEGIQKDDLVTQPNT